MGKEMEITKKEMVGIKKAIQQGMNACRQESGKPILVRTHSQEGIRRRMERKAIGGKMMPEKIWS